jgi:hypothetical protein
MSSLIYAILAILLLMFLGLNMTRGQLRTQDKMVVNEVATELSGVAYSVLDFIGRRPFDERTDESKITPPIVYPVITSTSQLTPAANFGGCTSMALVAVQCDDVDDYHLLTGSTTVGGLTYSYAISVRYVNPANPSQAAGSQTYAKEVSVTVQNPYLTMNGAPLPVVMRRVFSYNRHTTAP